MPKVYALLVGIDTYRLPWLALQGCVNDVRLAERTLRDRIEPADLSVRTLCDEQATRAAVIRLFRSHLGAAGADDIALFWFSGHGSTGPLPEEIWYAESAGMCQTTVCHDSRDTVPDLYDKELAVLVHEVVATGAQLVTIKDSCHARGGMRGDPATGLTPRLAPPSDTPPPVRDLLPELVRGAADPTRPPVGMQVPGHVALSACDEWAVANESVFTDGPHGVFSEALGRALARLGPDATYRQVLSDARCRVEGRFRRQVPTLEAVGDLADRVFLRGALRPRTARVTLRRIREEWEVDVGSVHGIVAGTRLAVHRAEPLQEVRVVDVQPGRSIVEPVGWSPDGERQYDMVLTDTPLPPVAVSIEASPDVRTRLTDAMQTSGPGRGPSPHIRLVLPGDEPTARLLLRVRHADGGRAIELTSADHEPLASPVDSDDTGIVQTVRDLEHVARWLQVRNLANPSPAIEDAVRIEVLPAPPDGARPPHDRAPLPAGRLDFAYTRAGTTWRPPSIFVRLRNTTDERLFCVLLDLTDRYRMHADLFPGEYVAGRWTAEVGGGPVTMSLPPDQPVEPGASVTDWLILLVAEEPFSSDPFSLPRLREAPRHAARGGRRGITGVLDRLGLLAVRRDVVPEPRVALDWGVKVVEITTSVPSW